MATSARRALAAQHAAGAVLVPVGQLGGELAPRRLLLRPGALGRGALR